MFTNIFPLLISLSIVRIYHQTISHTKKETLSGVLTFQICRKGKWVPMTIFNQIIIERRDQERHTSIEFLD